MREIPLASRKYPGLVALVDDKDYELVSQYNWHPHIASTWNRRLTPGRKAFYARTNTTKEDGRRSGILMHKLITGYDRTDHKDHNGLNNQRSNLRDVGQRENTANRQKETARRTASRFKGVSCYNSKRYPHKRKRWVAYIGSQNTGTRRGLGYFATEKEAALAYNRAATEMYGEFACLNEVA